MQQAKSQGNNLKPAVVVENASEWEPEGRFTELERRLWTMDREHKLVKPENAPSMRALLERRTDSAEGEGGKDYEPQGNGIQFWSQDYISEHEQMGSGRLADDPSHRADIHHAGWHDYEDSKTGHSNQQRNSNRRVLFGENFGSKGGRTTLKHKATTRNRIRISRKKRRDNK